MRLGPVQAQTQTRKESRKVTRNDSEKEPSYPWTEIPEKVTTARPRMGSPKMRAGSKTLCSKWSVI